MGDVQSTGACRPCSHRSSEISGGALPPPSQQYEVGGTNLAEKVGGSSSSTSLVIEPRSGKRPSQLQDGSRGARWLVEQMRTNDAVSTACNVVQLILDQDKLSPGMRADLEFVQKVLIERRGAGSVVPPTEDGADIEEAEVDDSTLEYLKTFYNDVKHKHKTFREVAQAVYFTQHLRRCGFKNTSTVRASNYITGINDSLVQALADIDSYNDFDIFNVATISGPQLLQHVTLTVFQKHRLVPQFNVSLPKLRSFMAEVEQNYKVNPYHSATHAADVVQTVHVFVGKLPSDTLSEMEVLTSIFAAACHDVGHDGVTNPFRVAALDEGAITYNDLSINENFHSSLTYRILQRDECNFLDSLTKMQAIAVRKMLIDIILSTDMANHFTKLAKFKSIVEEKGNVITRWESPTPALELMIHTADISNTTKPFHIATQWADRVLEEFFAQGDRERNLGRDISPLCDRKTVSKAGSQCGFVDFIVAPTFEAFGKICDVAEAQENLQKYRQHFGDLLAEEKKAKEADGTVRKVSSVHRSTKKSSGGKKLSSIRR